MCSGGYAASKCRKPVSNLLAVGKAELLQELQRYLFATLYTNLVGGLRSVTNRT